MIKQSKNYMVVDDDSTNNLICKFTIKKFNNNARVDLFLEPEKALMHIEQKFALTGQSNPTILFLDVNMPTMTGFEFLNEFKKFKIEIREQFTIYILSSSIEDFDIEANKYPFVAGFLSKPLRISYLEQISESLKSY